ncbi:MAG: glycosyltransferase, partial [Candidatus Eisenbacteria bacterium]
ATALIEAQADGVPVVATAVGGVPEVVQDGLTGRLIPRRDPEALAVAVIELLGDAERRAAMRNAARESARTFHIDRTVERTLQAYLVSRASNA